ncbi:PREDICTED: WD repeat-containing protein 18 [Nicrophorus vespilloides]|uniref:WD repeat-containing protein 18 n=1 Tax=Nicrophorus vespilloides TaxID=110193 RepID=A0ABM1NGW3_NICVS|nr:PREDICTED: WD repeat-containing protein 18 [Nicrophorus vespilloides]XP_017786056.1 PREDICTED: WD repeat-containing protein 18 [Nicrophorus vespilloides]XP_017786063.1 PREDICTED: WD repeat-containing protein 18 [Nicrophorus vespilloides]
MAKELLLTSQLQNSQQVSCCFWDYSNGNVLQVYKNGGSVPKKSMCLLGNDFLITAEHTKPLLHIWPLNNQEPLKNVRLVTPEPVNALAVCPRNTYLAVGIMSKLYIWELCSGKLLSVQQIHYQPITCIQFSNSGGYLVVTGEDGLIVTYNILDLINIKYKHKAQSELGQVDPLYKRMDHALPIHDLHIGKFSFKSRFATVSSDQTLRLYQLSDGELLLTLIFNSALTALCFDAPFFNAFVGNQEGLISMFDLTSSPRSLEHHVEESTLNFVGHKGKVTCLETNLFNNRLASASEDLNIFIWELKSRQILRKIELKSVPSNLKFVLTSEEMFCQNHKPNIVINSLERSLETDLNDTVVSTLQNDTRCVRESWIKRRDQEEQDNIEDLRAQIITIKKHNIELFTQLKMYQKLNI